MRLSSCHMRMEIWGRRRGEDGGGSRTSVIVGCHWLFIET